MAEPQPPLPSSLLYTSTTPPVPARQIRLLLHHNATSNSLTQTLPPSMSTISHSQTPHELRSEHHSLLPHENPHHERYTAPNRPAPLPIDSHDPHQHGERQSARRSEASSRIGHCEE
ncbi:hypothetical protein M758_3G162600 [Ceratodon purpureus]|uniref:Uncharacterized protein n=1 Tax=Ceratodon purpureus TaxID=3225 RepID=A0A8T0IJ08_CERPU|nr:hypothetical protein KC19_3G162800 [Ceratodon purpureus]KAG0623284.1 hypothetical protein M758_3G162600 [Ceratodon purpureus]